MADHNPLATPPAEDHQPQNAPIPEAVKNVVGGTEFHVRQTASDFRNLASGPSDADEQPLTYFHSFFYDLFSWKFPRATGFTFASTIIAILAFHYVNVLRYAFKGLYVLFAGAAVAEFAGKPFGVKGFASQLRPKRYYTVPRESIDIFFAEIHELMNFFVVEFQRLVFVENIFATIVAFLASALGYVLIKYIPIWGLLLLTSVVAFTAPLVYLQNQEAIDEQLSQISEIVNQKLTHARGMSEKYAQDAAAQARAATAQLGERFHEITAGRKSPTPAVKNEKEPIAPVSSSIREEDFPEAPRGIKVEPAEEKILAE